MTPEPLPQSELERIKALCEEATPGPWIADINIYGTGCRVATHDKELAIVNERHAGLTRDQAMSNAMLMAHARTGWPKCVAEIERLKEELAKTKAFKDEEHAIVQKVWKALGKETYREAKPFTIWEWVEKDKETITHLQTKLAETRKDKERLDWLLNALMEQGQILNQLGWADGRQAIDTAMKATK